jgi:hypothetical protein
MAEEGEKQVEPNIVIPNFPSHQAGPHPARLPCGQHQSLDKAGTGWGATVHRSFRKACPRKRSASPTFSEGEWFQVQDPVRHSGDVGDDIKPKAGSIDKSDRALLAHRSRRGMSGLAVAMPCRDNPGGAIALWQAACRGSHFSRIFHAFSVKADIARRLERPLAHPRRGSAGGLMKE